MKMNARYKCHAELLFSNIFMENWESLCGSPMVSGNLDSSNTWFRYASIASDVCIYSRIKYDVNPTRKIS